MRTLKMISCFVVLLLTGCTSEFVRSSPGPSSTPEITAAGELPGWVRESESNIVEAYQFALANPEILKKIPCYCGCADSGHKSNYDCYVKEVREDGSLVFDRHGSY